MKTTGHKFYTFFYGTKSFIRKIFLFLTKRLINKLICEIFCTMIYT